MRATDLHVSAPTGRAFSVDTCPEREVLLTRHEDHVPMPLSTDVLRAEDALELAIELAHFAKLVLEREGRLDSSEARTKLGELHNLTSRWPG